MKRSLIMPLELCAFLLAGGCSRVAVDTTAGILSQA
jgi:hypothetical protein